MRLERFGAAVVLAVAGGVVGAGSVARADALQNASVRASQGDLALAGFGAFSGAGQSIVQIEAGEEIARAGANPWLPAARFTFLPQGGAFGFGDSVGNHASGVAGVMVSSHPTQRGIARNASVIGAGVSDDDSFNANTQAGLQAGGRIVNMSLGTTRTTPGGLPANNGTSLDARFVDYAARNFNALMVVAGNEDRGTGVPFTESPSDAWNTINVGATGLVNGAGNLVYSRGAAYNRSNTTSDGRIKTDMVAPGGDPGIAGAAPGANGGPSAIGTFTALPAPFAVNRFFTTSGRQINLVGGQPTAPDRPQYSSDDFDNDGLTNDPYQAIDDTAPFIAGPVFPTLNPGANLGGNDHLLGTRIGGTSFAAPVVAGAASLVRELGTLNGTTLDRRVVKAVLMNGASKRAPDGVTPLTDQNGNNWTRSAANTPGKVSGVNGAAMGAQAGLDPNLGTGQLDTVLTLKNYDAGQQTPGNVGRIGFDLGNVSGGGRNSYSLTNVGGEFSATLAWELLVQLQDNPAAPNGQWDAGETFTAAAAVRDLDLELYRVDAGNVLTLVDFSTSIVDNAEHIFIPNLAAGNYRLDVANLAPLGETYGLAWRVGVVPAPAGGLLAVLGILSAGRRRRTA